MMKVKLTILGDLSKKIVNLQSVADLRASHLLVANELISNHLQVVSCTPSYGVDIIVSLLTRQVYYYERLYIYQCAGN
jgi:hypothetical protein